MPKMRKSEVQPTGYSLQRFYSWNSTTISSACYRNNGHPQICSMKEDQPKISRGRQIVLIFSICRAYINLFLSECSFCSAYQAQQSFSCHPAHFPGLPSSGGIAEQKSFLLAFIEDSILCNFMCHSVTKGRRFLFVEVGPSICIHQI
jgi:hypothetical protein